MSKEVLLTGGSGFLGGFIKQHLMAEGYHVSTIGRAATCDIHCDLATNIPLFPKSYDWVIHAMGKAHDMQPDAEIAQAYMDTNVTGTENLCAALSNAPSLPAAIVFISSVAVYGCYKGILIDENAPLEGKSAYAKSKLLAEEKLREWCAANGVSLTILRLPLVAAGNAPGNLGAMIQAIRNNRYFNIDGGTARKSMVMANDVAQWIPAVINHPGVYNLTDGVHPSFAELAHVISHQMGKRDPLNISKCMALPAAFCCGMLGKRAPISMDMLEKLTSTLTFNDAKARAKFGWNPQPVSMMLTINSDWENQS